MANMKSGEYHFFFFSSLLATHLKYLVYGGACSVGCFEVNLALLDLIKTSRNMLIWNKGDIIKEYNSFNPSSSHYSKLSLLNFPNSTNLVPHQHSPQKKGAPQAPTDKPSSSGKGYCLGGWPLKAWGEPVLNLSKIMVTLNHVSCVATISGDLTPQLSWSLMGEPLCVWGNFIGKWVY